MTSKVTEDPREKKRSARPLHPVKADQDSLNHSQKLFRKYFQTTDGEELSADGRQLVSRERDRVLEQSRSLQMAGFNNKG